MILGDMMQMFEDILYEEDERAITGFINSSDDLEYSIYEYADGGFIDLENREYAKNELTDLLVDELEYFVKNISPITLIRNNDVKIYLHSHQYATLTDVAQKLNKLADAILNKENIYVISKNADEYWKFIK
jgi:hypothetical protein